MDLEYDKEIDALLRQKSILRPGDGTDMAEHLTPDQISAFAENALPRLARAPVVAHFSQCSRCREILAYVISLSTDEPQNAAASSKIAVTGAPAWYRRFFVFPRLAYVLGSLVLVFSGFLAWSVVKNASPRTAEVSSVKDVRQPEVARRAETPARDERAGETNTSANAASNSSAENAPDPPVSDAARKAVPNAAGLERLSIDPKSNVAKLESPKPTANIAAQIPAEAPREAAEPKEQTATAKPAAEASQGATESFDLQQSKKSLEIQTDGNTNSALAKNRSENEKRSAAMSLTDAAESRALRSDVRSKSIGNNRRRIDRKIFELKQGVWYDASYQGQATVNIGRGTDAFNKLDGATRSIARQLDGVVVIVTSGKAYRIQ